MDLSVRYFSVETVGKLANLSRLLLTRGSNRFSVVFSDNRVFSRGFMDGMWLPPSWEAQVFGFDELLWMHVGYLLSSPVDR